MIIFRIINLIHLLFCLKKSVKTAANPLPILLYLSTGKAFPPHQLTVNVFIIPNIIAPHKKIKLIIFVFFL